MGTIYSDQRRPVMANYQDYVSKDNELEDEINEAADQSATREGESSFAMPDRFKGKTPEDIAKSYAELERLNSRQAQDLGTMRRTVDEFLDLQSNKPNERPERKEAPAAVTVDDLYNDPDETISRKVEQVAGSRISKLEKELEQARLQTRVESLTEQYPDWQERVRTPEFVDWVKGSPYRLRMAQAADGWDLDAAEELLALHDDVRGATNAKDRAQRERQLANASLETGVAASQVHEVAFSRSELMETRVRAAQGDTEAQAYMRKNADAIAIAYEEGNITD